MLGPGLFQTYSLTWATIGVFEGIQDSESMELHTQQWNNAPMSCDVG